jgi:hypothetical protein
MDTLSYTDVLCTDDVHITSFYAVKVRFILFNIYRDKYVKKINFYVYYLIRRFVNAN